MRVDVTDSTERWRWACPSPERHQGTSVRVVDGLFECRRCEETYEYVVDTKTGRRYHRSEIEFVGPGSKTKGAMGRPTVDD